MHRISLKGTCRINKAGMGSPDSRGRLTQDSIWTIRMKDDMIRLHIKNISWEWTNLNAIYQSNNLQESNLFIKTKETVQVSTSLIIRTIHGEIQDIPKYWQTSLITSFLQQQYWDNHALKWTLEISYLIHLCFMECFPWFTSDAVEGRAINVKWMLKWLKLQQARRACVHLTCDRKSSVSNTAIWTMKQNLKQCVKQLVNECIGWNHQICERRKFILTL